MADLAAMRLDWPDCRNARDLGGLPAGAGRRIRRRALVRSDSLDRLSAAGRRAVRAHGLTRIVDLRAADEAKLAPGPFDGEPIYRLRPLIDPDADLVRDPAAEPTPAATYRASVIRNIRNIGLGLAAIADAPDGCVLVHCAAGKDRTGMTIALALRTVGVPATDIAADYAFSAVCLRDQFQAEMAAAADDEARAHLRNLHDLAPGNILGMLSRVDEAYGDIDGYLAAAGLTPIQVGRLRDRLVG
jgi:protein tyrosine/serine phosphatase